MNLVQRPISQQRLLPSGKRSTGCSQDPGLVTLTLSLLVVHPGQVTSLLWAWVFASVIPWKGDTGEGGRAGEDYREEVSWRVSTVLYQKFSLRNFLPRFFSLRNCLSCAAMSLVIYHRTNYPKLSSFSNTYDLTVAVGQESGLRVAGPLMGPLTAFRQTLGQGCSHPRLNRDSTHSQAHSGDCWQNSVPPALWDWGLPVLAGCRPETPTDFSTGLLTMRYLVFPSVRALREMREKNRGREKVPRIEGSHSLFRKVSLVRKLTRSWTWQLVASAKFYSLEASQ